MPFTRNAELPNAVKSVLPAEGQTIFRNVVNDQLENGVSEEKAFVSAWGALKNQGWQKGEDGKWKKVEKMFEKTLTGKITKVDSVKKVAYGWAYVSTVDGEHVPDHSGDVWGIDEIEKTAHQFVTDCREGGVMHVEKGGAKLVSSIVLSKEVQEALGIDLKKEGWFVGFEIQDEELLKRVENGELAMFSIGGIGEREEA